MNEHVLLGALALAACAPDADAPDGATSGTDLNERRHAPDRETILERLDDVGLLETGDPYETRTTHTWDEDSSSWVSTEEELREGQINRRMLKLVHTAQVVTRNTEPEIPDWVDGDELCFGSGDAFCLTIEAHEAHIEALDALEIIEVEDMVRDEAVAASCYSSWYTVTEADCKRAYLVEALVEATADFPSRETPE